MPRRTAFTLLLVLAVPAAGAAELDEVTVTATRRPAPLRAHAGSVTRLDATDLAVLGATHAEEALNRAAGAMLQRGSGQESLVALRSPVLTGAGACGAVLVLEDGLPIRPVGACNVNQLFETGFEQAAAIEVLRGPGSALYGSSAVHGIVNVIPPAPGDLPPLALGLETGSDGWRRLRAAGGGAQFAGTLLVTRDGGWRDQAGFREQKAGAAWDRATAGDGRLRLRIAANRLDQQTAGFISGREAYRDRALARSNPDPEAYRDARSLRLSAHYASAGEAFEWRALLRSSRMDFLQHFLLGQPTEDNGQDSAALLFTWRSGDWTGGLDLEAAAITLLQRQDGPTTGGSPAANAIRPAGRHYDYEVDSRLAAAYAEWRRVLAPGWTLQAGARIEALRYDYDNRMRDGNTDERGLPCPGGCLYARPADRRDDFTSLAPRLALAWDGDRDFAAYLSLARGFRAPEATELYRLQRQQSVADLDPETIDALEAGWRWRGKDADLDLAAFAMQKRGVILRNEAGFNVAGGRTGHRGLEYRWRWRPAPGWELEAAGTWARHRYEFSASVEQGETIRSGDDMDTAPRHLHRAWLRHAGPHWRAELEWVHVGRHAIDAANTAWYGGHDLANLRIARDLPQGLALALRVSNLLDVDYADRADFAFGNHRYFPGRPRAIFVELAWQPLQSRPNP